MEAKRNVEGKDAGRLQVVDALKKSSIGLQVTVTRSVQYFHVENVVPDDGTE